MWGDGTNGDCMNFVFPSDEIVNGFPFLYLHFISITVSHRNFQNSANRIWQVYGFNSTPKSLVAKSLNFSSWRIVSSSLKLNFIVFTNKTASAFWISFLAFFSCGSTEYMNLLSSAGLFPYKLFFFWGHPAFDFDPLQPIN